MAEVEELVETGELEPDSIHTPGIYVDRIIQGENYEKRIEFRTVQGSAASKKESPVRELMARRAAQELRDGYCVNLGIGIPTLGSRRRDGPRRRGERVVAVMEHCAKDGSPKILQQCTLPVTGRGVVSLSITDLCVFAVKPAGGLVLTELHPGVTVDDLRAKTGAPFSVALTPARPAGKHF